MIARVVAPVAVLLLLLLQAGGLVSVSAATLQTELVSPDGGVDFLFGYSVSLDGNTLLVGEPWGNSSRGAAYVYVRNGGVWTLQQQLTAPDAAVTDQFGISVALSADTAVVGAYGKERPCGVPATCIDAGGAYIFRRTAGTWNLEATLAPDPAPAPSGSFGFTVAIDGDTVLVAHPRCCHQGATSDETGRVAVYVRSGAVWTPQTLLAAGDISSGDRFGTSIAIDGDTAVIGAANNKFTPGAGCPCEHGSAYVFQRSGGVWTQQAQLWAPIPVASDNFGSAVAISGDTVFVVPKPTATTAVHVYVRSGSAWPLQTTLAADFAVSLAIGGNTLIAGRPEGFAHVFTRSGAVWTTEALLADPGGVAPSDFAFTVATDGNTVVAGLPRKEIGSTHDQGTVMIFTDVVPPAPAPPPVPPPTPAPPTGPPPTITAIADQTVLINGVVGPLSFTVGGRILADALDVTATSSDPVLVAPSSLVLGRISGAVRTLTLRPADGRMGSATITLTVSDGYDATSTRFLLTVVATMPPPVPPPPLPPTPPTLPGAPRDVVAALSGSGIDLTWREPSTGPVQRYVVAGGLAAGDSILPVLVTRDGALSARIDGLPAMTYYLRVYAVGPAALGPPSTEVVFTMPASGGPVLAPSFGLRVIAQTGRRVTIAWEAPVAGVATSHRVDAGATLGTLAPVTTIVERSLTLDLTTPLWMQVRALSGGTTSAPTQPLYVAFEGPCTAPPGAPIMLPSYFLGGLTTLSWLPGDGASQYRVVVTPTTGLAQSFDAFGGSSLVLPVAPTAIQSVRLLAANACGETVSP